MNTEDWHKVKLKDVFDLSSGKTKPDDLVNASDSKHPYPVYGGNGIMGYSGSSLLKKGAIIIGRVGAYCGTVRYVDQECWITDNAIYTNTINEDYDPRFLKELLSFKKLYRLRNKGGQPLISQKPIYNLRLSIPYKDEQIKIRGTLSTWDKAISKTEKLIKAKKRYKKGLMQRLLSGKVRFPEFEGEDWVETRLGELVKQAKRKVQKPDDEYLSIGIRSHGKGTFQKPDKDPDDNSMTSLYKVKENDLIVNITFAWEGAIAIVKKEDENGYVSHRFPTYEFDTEKLIPDYFQYVIVQPWFVYKLGLISPGGAGRNRVLNKKDFLKLKVKVPSISEQNKIAEVLTTVDDEIDLLETQLECYQKQKKGLMQKLLTGKVRVQNMETA